MPLYEYQCNNEECKHVVEEFVNSSAEREDGIDERVCDKCGWIGAKIIMSLGFFQMDPIA